MSFQSIFFHGYHIKGEDLFMVATAQVSETIPDRDGNRSRQIVLPVYSKYTPIPYSLVLMSQAIAVKPTTEQEEEWNVCLDYRLQVHELLVHDWEKQD